MFSIDMMLFCAGKLDLKIPWKRLTKDPLVITIDEIYVILVPNIGMRFDSM